MTHEISNAKKEIDYDCEVSSQDIADRIAVCRLKLMSEQPFYSSLALRLNYKEEEKIPTAAVDGKNFFYNRHFINALDNEELKFVMVHEILHIVFKHLTRRGKRNAKLWNSAGDYVINGIIYRDRIGRFPDIGGLLDDKYKDKSTDEVYHILEKEGNSGGNNFDVHVTVNGGSGSDGNDSSSSGNTTVSENGDMETEMSEDEMNEMEDEVVGAVMEAMKAAQGAGAGKVPGEVSRMVDDYLEPRVDWRSFIHETANAMVKNDYDRRRPNRRFPIHQFGVALPTLKKDDHVEFTLAIDTSGSIDNNMLQEFFSEVIGIVEVFSSFNVDVWCFDTKVYDHSTFNQDNLDEMYDYEIKGGGGTDFMSNWEYMKEIEHMPQIFIMMTDGMPWNSWGDEDYCDTIFLIHDQHQISNKVEAPFGTTLYFDDF